ncbi:MAG: twin-arginine translocase TatA/TatE family subunit [Sulfurimonas sp.]|jgi:sec-independent protein translocase protein TatA
MLGMSGGWEWLVVLAIVVILFGGKKIPELAKGLGKGIKNFKQEMKEVDEVATDAPKKVEKSEEVASAEETPKSTTQA